MDFITLFKLTTTNENSFDCPFEEGARGLSLFRSDRPPLLIQLSITHKWCSGHGGGRCSREFTTPKTPPKIRRGALMNPREQPPGSLGCRTPLLRGKFMKDF